MFLTVMEMCFWTNQATCNYMYFNKCNTYDLGEGLKEGLIRGVGIVREASKEITVCPFEKQIANELTAHDLNRS